MYCSNDTTIRKGFLGGRSGSFWFNLSEMVCVCVCVCDFNLFEFIKESELIDPPLRNAYSLGPICNHPPLARDQINILIFK